MPQPNPHPEGSAEWWAVHNFNENERRAHEDLVNPDRAGAMGLGANYAGGVTSGVVDVSGYRPQPAPPPPAPPQPTPPPPAAPAAGAAPTITGASVGTQPEGTSTPFGPITGGIPGGLGLDWQRLLAEATGYIQGQKTLGREVNEAEIAYRLAAAALAQAQAAAVPSEANLRTAQAALANAQAAGIPSEIALRVAQAGYVSGPQSDLARAQSLLAQAQAGAIPSEIALREAQALLAGAQTEYQRARIPLEAGELTGFYQGTPTLEREKFSAEQQEKAYQREANPARAFENELARSPNAMGPSTAAAAGQAIGTGAGTGALWSTNYAAPSGLDPQGERLGEPMVRVPGFVTAFRTGQYVPTAGQVSQPNTTAPASQAALGEDAFRLANQPTLANYSPNQSAILGSYGRAGGVTDEQQQYWMSRGRPRGGSASPTYSFAA